VAQSKTKNIHAYKLHKLFCKACCYQLLTWSVKLLVNRFYDQAKFQT
jgi:hypothetical protein